MRPLLVLYSWSTNKYALLSLMFCMPTIRLVSPDDFGFSYGKGKKRHGPGILIHSQSSVSQPILELEWAINSWKHEKMRIFVLTYLWRPNFIYLILVKVQSRQMQLKIVCFFLNRISKWIQLRWQRLQSLICLIWIEFWFEFHFVRSQKNHSHANWRPVHL